VSGPDIVKVLVGLGERSGDATMAAIIRNMCCDKNRTAAIPCNTRT
jgi:hypothetical protein